MSSNIAFFIDFPLLALAKKVWSLGKIKWHERGYWKAVIEWGKSQFDLIFICCVWKEGNLGDEAVIRVSFYINSKQKHTSLSTHLLYFHYKEKVSHREFVKHDVICLIHLWPSPVLWSSKTSITACLKLYNLPLTSAAAGRKLTNDRLVMADTMFRSTAVILLPRQHLWTKKRIS